MRMVVEPFALCHVHKVCLGVVGCSIYIFRRNMCMGGAMTGWCCRVFYFGVFVHLLLCNILSWGGPIGCWLVCAFPCYVCWCGGRLCVYLCNIIVDGGNCRVLLSCIGYKVRRCLV